MEAISYIRGGADDSQRLELNKQRLQANHFCCSKDFSVFCKLKKPNLKKKLRSRSIEQVLFLKLKFF
jgi:hypothetical protein